MKKPIIGGMLVALAQVAFSAGTADKPEAPSLRILAAANVQPVFSDLAAAFARRRPGIVLEPVFGASGTLSTHIRNGAPADLFLAADMAFADAFYRDGLAADRARAYARGVLILWTVKPFPAGWNLDILNSPAVVKVAVANPETAPYGRAARESLEALGLKAAVQPKIVQAQSIAQTVQLTQTAADVGFVNKSALFSPELAAVAQEGVHWVAVPDSAYTPILQGFVVLKNSAHPELARVFADFLLSPEAAAVFAQYGYREP